MKPTVIVFAAILGILIPAAAQSHPAGIWLTYQSRNQHFSAKYPAGWRHEAVQPRPGIDIVNYAREERLTGQVIPLRGAEISLGAEAGAPSAAAALKMALDKIIRGGAFDVRERSANGDHAPGACPQIEILTFRNDNSPGPSLPSALMYCAVNGRVFMLGLSVGGNRGWRRYIRIALYMMRSLRLWTPTAADYRPRAGSARPEHAQ